MFWKTFDKYTMNKPVAIFVGLFYLVAMFIAFGSAIDKFVCK